MKNSTEREPSEHAHQSTLISWYDETFGDDLLFAIPNGGKRPMREALKLKLEGVRPGVSDLFLAVARGGYHGLFIEMKKLKGSYPTDEQKEFIENMRAQGYRAEVCKGYEAAIELITEYLNAPTR